AVARRQQFGLVRLASGKVLVAGGVVDWTARDTDKAELFDPATGVWTPTAPMPQTRDQFSASLLDDGTVLVAGGNNHPADYGAGTQLDSTLIFNPSGPTWTPAASLGGVRGG